MKRKGQFFAEGVPLAIVFLFILTAISIALLFVISAFSEKRYLIPEGLEEFSSTNRLYYSPSCFVANDMYRVLDWEKFTERQLNTCYPTAEDSSILALRLQLSIGDVKSSQIQTTNWNNKEPFSSKITQRITILQDNTLTKGQLMVEVQEWIRPGLLSQISSQLLLPF